MIRARVHREADDVWLFSILDDDGIPFVVGNAPTWDEAVEKARRELQLFAGGISAGPVRPVSSVTPPLVSPAAQERSWLARMLCLGVAA
jgi:hypothetical protein